MNVTQAAGFLLTVGGVIGYLVGLTAPYPGRAFSIAGVMVGLTLLSVGGLFG